MRGTSDSRFARHLRRQSYLSCQATFSDARKWSSLKNQTNGPLAQYGVNNHAASRQRHVQHGILLLTTSMKHIQLISADATGGSATHLQRDDDGVERAVVRDQHAHMDLQER